MSETFFMYDMWPDPADPAEAFYVVFEMSDGWRPAERFRMTSPANRRMIISREGCDHPAVRRLIWRARDGAVQGKRLADFLNTPEGRFTLAARDALGLGPDDPWPQTVMERTIE